MRILLAAAFAAAAFRPVNAQIFSRADDTRAKPPERWGPAKEHSLSLRLGGSFLRGNVQHEGVSAGLDAMRWFAERHQVLIEGRGDYSAFAGKALIDKRMGSLLYAYALKPKLNLFANTTHSSNEFLQLMYRTTNGGGVCVHGFVSGFDPFLISVALTPEYERYRGGIEENEVRAPFRLNLGRTLTPFVDLGADFFYVPALSELKDYRLFAEVYLQFKVTSEKVFYRVTYSDEYDSRPQPRVKSNDTSLGYSLVVRFAR